MTSQKHLFDLPADIHYLNGAYMSPLMKTVEAAGVAGIKRKLNPATYYADDFFLPAEEVRRKFGKCARRTDRSYSIGILRVEISYQ